MYNMLGSSFKCDFSQKLIIIPYVSQFSNETPYLNSQMKLQYFWTSFQTHYYSQVKQIDI